MSAPKLGSVAASGLTNLVRIFDAATEPTRGSLWGRESIEDGLRAVLSELGFTVAPAAPTGDYIVMDVDGDVWVPDFGADGWLRVGGGIKYSWATLADTRGPLTVYRPATSEQGVDGP